jgi:long-chain acyl-CoA synthetase
MMPEDSLSRGTIDGPAGLKDLQAVSADALPPAHRSANEAWLHRIGESADRPAYKFKEGGSWQTVSWRAADLAASEVAAGFAAAGMRTGDRVCILAQTRYEWMLCDVGGLLAGAVPVPIYPSSTAEQSAYIVRDAGARLVVVEDAAQLEKLVPLLLTGMDLQLVYLEGDAKLDRPDGKGRSEIRLDEVLAPIPREAARRIVSFAEFRVRGQTWGAKPENAADLARRRVAPGPDDPFTIIYTSGTTGNPKGVVLSHGNLMAECSSAIRALTLSLDDVHYLWLTLAHVFARVVAWASLYKGFPVVFAESLPKLKDNLLEVQPTFMAGVPRIYEKFYTGVKAGLKQGGAVKRALVRWALGVGQRHSILVRAGKTPGGLLAFQQRLADKLVFSKLRAKLGLNKCRFLISGGAPLAAEIAEFFHVTGLLILEGYGLTETTAAAFVNRIENYRFGTVGPLMDVFECKIAEDGEILLKGAGVFKRYHNNPAATAEAIDADGWFHTGDIGELNDGFLRITDRKKDLIVLAGGKKVAPQVLENAIKARSSLISQALVYGDRKAYIVALLTLGEEAVKRYGEGDAERAAKNPEVRAALEAEVKALNANLASFETIKHFAVLPDDFTEANGLLTPSLKVKRKIAVERHRAAIDALYAGGGSAAD